MGRKNSRVGRKNDRGRYSREARGELAAKLPPRTRIPVEALVMPDGRCDFMNPRKPKARFSSEDKAKKALEQAQKRRAQMGSGHVEKRYYKCPEGGCGGWHLSSREAFDESIRQLREEQYQQKTKNMRLAQIRAEREAQ